jgi:hypothetical protein
MFAFISVIINRQIERQIQPLKNQIGEIMANQQQFSEVLGRIDTATTAAATVLNDIRARIAQLESNAGISAEEEASVLSKLDTVAKSLEQMAKNPENPVPVEPGNPGNPTDPNASGTGTPGQPAGGTQGAPATTVAPSDAATTRSVGSQPAKPTA